jgi:hypothetical protein
MQRGARQMVSVVVGRFEGWIKRKKGEGGVKCRVGSKGQIEIQGYRFGKKLVGGLMEALYPDLNSDVGVKMWRRWREESLDDGGLRSIFRCFAGTVLMLSDCVFRHFNHARYKFIEDFSSWCVVINVYFTDTLILMLWFY